MVIYKQIKWYNCHLLRKQQRVCLQPFKHEKPLCARNIFRHGLATLFTPLNIFCFFSVGPTSLQHKSLACICIYL